MTAFYYCFRQFFRISFRLYFRCSIYNVNRVPAQGPVVMASNHASFMDPPMAGIWTARPVHCMARSTLFDNPVLGWIIRGLEAIPVDRDGGSAAGLKTILAKLAEGKQIVLFPEGTRTRDGQLQPVRSGLGMIAIKSKAPIVPVRIFGNFEAYNRKMLIPRPRKVIVKFGHPLHFEKLINEAATCSRERLKEIYQEASDEVMKAIAALEPVNEPN